jgi:uroporphyrinogen-III decarboxylase
MSDTASRYQARLRRYLTAMRNEKPDMVPLRPFAAEITAKIAGFTNQEVTHDYRKAFDAVCITADRFDWDAMVGNMVYIWTGLTQALSLRYYGVPGIDVPGHSSFQYLEPAEDEEFMREDEYDLLIANPTDFLLNVWLPRVLRDVPAPGRPATSRAYLALVKGALAMNSYFNAFGAQHQRMIHDHGVVPAIAGILKSPFDIIADKLRGYVGLTMDMAEQPDKVLAAAEALMPHMYHTALTTADPARQVPVGFWMHRGCVPFITPRQYETHYWPTLKPIIENLWAHGHQTLFYAEGDWGHHLDSFAELPDASIVYHVDRGDIFSTHQKIGHKFCLSGGLSNTLLSFGTPDDVRAACRRILDGVARDGGYIMDASAIMQDDTSIENLQAMTDFTREHGVYSGTATGSPLLRPCDGHPYQSPAPVRQSPDPAAAPGIVLPWEHKRRELPATLYNEELLKRIWDGIEAQAHGFIYQCLVSF